MTEFKKGDRVKIEVEGIVTNADEDGFGYLDVQFGDSHVYSAVEPEILTLIPPTVREVWDQLPIGAEVPGHKGDPDNWVKRSADQYTLGRSGTYRFSISIFGYDFTQPYEVNDPFDFTGIERPVELLNWGVGTVLMHRLGSVYVKIDDKTWLETNSRQTLGDNTPAARTSLRDRDVVAKNYTIYADPAGVWS